MKKLSALVFAFALTAIFAFKTGDDRTKFFTELMGRAHMTFTKPDGFEQVPVIDNNQVAYQYAMKYKGKNFEVRYSIMPLDSFVIDYNNSLKDTTKQVIEPNRIFASMVVVTAMNASMGSDGGAGEPNNFNEDAVKQEFNADEGKVIRFEPGKEFGQNYTIGMLVALHKKDVGDAYIFFLSDSKEGFTDMMMPAFHSLKFK